MQTPMLILGDSPETNTGLARIARQLALRIAGMPEFRVAFLGKGGTGSTRFPFPVMQIPDHPKAEWGEAVIHRAAEDWFRGERGIVFTIWDISRVGYLAMPEILSDDYPCKPYLMLRPFRLWGYFPVDCTHVGNRYHPAFKEGYRRYDRKLFYTRWARDLALVSGIGGDVDWIPHGIEANAGCPERPKTMDGILRVGSVGTNQARKDWGLTMGTVAWLKEKLGACRLWAHVDRPYVPGRWNLPALAVQFGIEADVAITSGDLSDRAMALHYADCDATIGLGLGEGFGLPMAESLACGTPVVHGDYAGGADWLRQCGLDECLVEPMALRCEGEYGAVRPVFKPDDFGEAILRALAIKPERCREAVEHLLWTNLFPGVWAKWLRRALA